MSVDELVNNFNIQKKKINLFKFLKKNDKLMENSIENNLYIEPPSYFRFIKRWWYGEDKETAFKHLDNYFIEFIKFLDTINLLSDLKNIISIDIPSGVYASTGKSSNISIAANHTVSFGNPKIGHFYRRCEFLFGWKH